MRGEQCRTIGGRRDRDGLVRLVEGRRWVAVHSFGWNDIGKDDTGKGTGVFVDGKVPGSVESWWIVDRCDRQGEGSRLGAVVVRRGSRWPAIDGDHHDAHRTVGIFGQGEAQLTSRVDCRTDCEHRIVVGGYLEGDGLRIRTGVFIGRSRWACQDVGGPRSQVRSGVFENRQVTTCGKLRWIVDRSDAHGDRPSGALLTRLVGRIVGNDVADEVLADEIQWWNVIESNDATVAEDRQDNTTPRGKLFDIGHTNGLAFGDLIGRTRQIVRKNICGLDRDSGVFGGGCQITGRDRRIVHRNDVDRENTLDRDIGVRRRSRRAVVPQGHPNPSILTRIAVDVLGRLIDQRTIDTNGGLHHKRGWVKRDDFERQLLIRFIASGDRTWTDTRCKARNRHYTLVFVGCRGRWNREFRSVIDWSNDDRERCIGTDIVVRERTCATVINQVDDDNGCTVLVWSRHEGQFTGR